MIDAPPAVTPLNPDGTVKTPSAIVTTGGDDATLLSRLFAAIDRHLRVVAIVADPSMPDDVLRLIVKDRPEAVVVKTSRPHLDDLIVDVLDRSVEYLINTGYNSIIKPRILDSLKIGALNLHPSALPLNRGCHHSFWGIMDETMHGATFHWMDSGLDTGDIIDQITFPDDGVMAAAEIQRRAEDLFPELLHRNLGRVIAGTASRRPQGDGSYHAKKDIRTASTLDWDQTVTVGHIVKLARATCAKGHGFFVRKGDRTFVIRAQVGLVAEELTREVPQVQGTKP